MKVFLFANINMNKGNNLIETLFPILSIYIIFFISSLVIMKFAYVDDVSSVKYESFIKIINV